MGNVNCRLYPFKKVQHKPSYADTAELAAARLHAIKESIQEKKKAEKHGKKPALFQPGEIDELKAALIENIDSLIIYQKRELIPDDKYLIPREPLCFHCEADKNAYILYQALASLVADLRKKAGLPVQEPLSPFDEVTKNSLAARRRSR